MCDFLQPHGLQHARLLSPLLFSRVISNSCPLSWWCSPTISSSATLFPFHLQSFPNSGSFPMSQLFQSGGQNIGASVSVSVLPMNIKSWFPGLISLKSKGLSRVFCSTTIQSISSSVLRLLYRPVLTSIHDYQKNQRFDYIGKVVMSPLFNILSRFVWATREVTRLWWASPVTQRWKICLPVQEPQERWVQPQVQEDSLQESMATHSSILAWRIPWTEEPGGLQSIGSQRIRHNWSYLACMHEALS